MSNKVKATDMKEDGQPALVPKLRFSEFRDAEGWEEKRLGDEGEFFSSLTGKVGDDFDAGEARFVTYMNVFSNTFVDSKALRFVNVKEGENQNAVVSGDVFFTISSETPDEVGMSSVLLEELENCYLNSFCALFRFSENKRADPVFTGYLLRQPLVRGYFTKKAQGSTRFNLSKDAFRSLPLFVPSPAEQQKIAECLSSVDELIAAEAGKLDALKTHKKGLMQQLFPREGLTQPRLRFPEFQNAGAWEEKQLGDTCVLVRGPFGGSLKKEIFVESGYAVYEQSHAIYGDFTSFRYYIPEAKYDELKRFSVKPGDIIMSCSGTMGKFAIVPQGASLGVINQALLKLSVKRGCIPVFLKEVLELPTNQEQLLSQSAGGAIKNVVSVSQIKELELLIPSLAEQQRIVDCLSCLDDLIAAQSAKLEALKTHKKGLMQQLFPSLEEVEA